MSGHREDNLFGRLALHYELVTREQVNQALAEQSREGGRRRIGEILMENGWLSRQHFERLLEIQTQYQARLAEERSSGAGEATAGAPEGEVPGTGPSASGPGDPAPPTAVPRRSAPPAEAAATATGDGPDSLANWLRIAADRGASDLHLHAGQPPRVRIHGELVEASPEPLGREQAETLLRGGLDTAQLRALDETGQVDLAADVEGAGRFRGNVYRQQHGVDGVFRLIPAEPPTLTDLGLPLDLARFANFHQGLVLVTGPGGCGKSSTLAALVDIVNRERAHHVISIEDPVEIVHRSRRSIVNQRQVEHHTESFARALRAALREDPDVIVVGELRDLETISLALTAAETGHLVLATLHTTNAISTINRVVGVFPPQQQPQVRTMVSESLRAVVCQRLVRRADGTGRVPALEILVATKAVSNLVRENKTFQIRSVLQTGSSRGMRSLDASLEALVTDGTISATEARRHAENAERFAEGRHDAGAAPTAPAGSAPEGGSP